MINQFLGSLDRACGTTVTLPALPADPNCISVPYNSQIWALIITPCTAADPFEIVSSNPPSLVAGEIDNDNADNTKSRQLVGIGSIAEHEPTIYEGPAGVDLVTKRMWTLSFEVGIGDSLIYDFLRNLQLNPQVAVKHRIWFINLSDQIFGTILASTVTDAYGGIRPDFVNVQFPHGGGREDRLTGTISIRWTADVDPPMYASPLTYVDACAPA